MGRHSGRNPLTSATSAAHVASSSASCSWPMSCQSTTLFQRTPPPVPEGAPTPLPLAESGFCRDRRRVDTPSSGAAAGVGCDAAAASASSSSDRGATASDFLRGRPRGAATGGASVRALRPRDVPTGLPRPGFSNPVAAAASLVAKPGDGRRRRPTPSSSPKKCAFSAKGGSSSSPVGDARRRRLVTPLASPPAAAGCISCAASSRRRPRSATRRTGASVPPPAAEGAALLPQTGPFASPRPSPARAHGARWKALQSPATRDPMASVAKTGGGEQRGRPEARLTRFRSG